MTTTRTTMGLSRSQPLGNNNALRNNAAHLVRVHRLAYLFEILDIPFWARLPEQVGVVINRLDVGVLLQAIIKSCATQPQTPRSLFGCKHSFLLHCWRVLKLSIPIDKENVKTYNTI